MIPEYDFCCGIFKKYGVEINVEKYEKLLIYAKFLVEYNEKVNLTALTEPNDILIKHFLDSILLLKYVDIPENSAIIDVGTGAGFPSVPIKIMRPDLRITLLDSLQKRIVFLQQLCDKVGADAQFIHGRAEDFSKLPEYREKFDFSTARAVANMSLLSELCIPFVRVGGSFLAMKGRGEDIESGMNAVKLLGGCVSDIHDYSLEGDERKILVVSKISATPEKYPRNSSKLKKSPL